MNAERLNRLAVGTRLGLVALAPLSLAAIAGIIAAVEAFDVASEAGKLRERAAVERLLSDVVHNLQKERGRSAGALAAGMPEQKRQLLDEQRAETNSTLAALEAAATEDVEGLLQADAPDEWSKVQAVIGELDLLRERVNDQELDVAGAAGEYTRRVRSFIELARALSSAAPGSDVARLSMAQYALAHAKDRAGIERAVGNAGLSKGHFGGGLLKKFHSLRSSQTAYLELFGVFAPSEAVDRLSKSTATAAIEEIRGHVDTTQGRVDSERFDSEMWWKASTAWVDQLREVEGFVQKHVASVVADKEAAARAQLMWMFGLAVGALLMVLFLVRQVAGSIAEPVRDVSRSLLELADGASGVDVPHTTYGSAIGDIARATHRLQHELANRAQRAELAERQRLEQQHAREAAAEALRKREADELAARLTAERERAKRAQAIEELARGFNKAMSERVSTLAAAATSLEATSRTLVDQSHRGQQQSGEAAKISDSTRQSVAHVASASTHISQAIGEMQRRVDETRVVSDQASAEARGAKETVTRLQSACGRVGEIVAFINEIATETNLLALNATIESARAGEKGKGFAVVASSVKRLASQTTNATSSISEQISDLDAVAKDIGEVMTRVSHAVLRMTELTAIASQAIDEQSQSSVQIATNAQAASSYTDEVAGRIQTLERVSESTHSSSEVVQQAAATVARETSDLQSMVDEFVSNMRIV